MKISTPLVSTLSATILSCLLSSLILFIPNTGQAQFQRNYGNTLDDSFSKVIQDGTNYYVLGQTEPSVGVLHRATVTRLDANGIHQWTLSLDIASVWNDAVLTQNGDLLVVGHTLPFDATNKSLMGLVTSTGGGNFSCLRSYDEPGREFFNRIVKNPVPEDAAFPYYILGSQNQAGATATTEDVVLLNVDANCNFKWKKIYTSNADDEFFRDLEALPNGDLLLAGNNGTGRIFQADNTGNIIGGVQISDIVFNDVGQKDSNSSIFASANGASGAHVLKFGQGLFPLVWDVIIPQLSTITQVWEGSSGDIYVTGRGTFNGANRAVIIKLLDNGPTIDWVKYLNAGSGFIGGSSWWMPSGHLAYTDSRVISGGFGGDCAFMSLSDLDLLDACQVSEDMATLVFADPLPEGPIPPPIDFWDFPMGTNLTSSALNWLQAEVCNNDPCGIAIDVNFVDSCGHIQVTSTSTGPAPYSYQWCSGENTPNLDVILPCGPHTFCVTLTCGDGSTATASQQITVSDNIPPSAICVPPFGVDLDTNCMYNVTVGMIDGGSFDNCQIQSMSVSPQVLTGCGVFPITLTVEDWCGNISTCMTEIQTIEVVPPSMTCPVDITLHCDDDLDPVTTGSPVVFDNCDPNPVVTYTDAVFGQMPCDGLIQRTWTATDSCGNVATCVQNILVFDNEAPTITCPSDMTVTSSSTSPCEMVVNGIQWLSLTDNCGTPTVSYTITGATTLSGNGDASGQVFNQGVSTVTYTAMDECGNMASCSFNIEIACSPCSNSAPNLGLTGYFPFYANANDFSPTNLNGIIIGSPAVISGHDNVPNSAYNFNGSSDWIGCGLNNRGISNEVSICAWVRTAELNNGQWIAGKYSFSDDKGYLLTIGDNSNNNIGLVAFSGRDGSGIPNGYHSSGYSLASVNDNEWHCVVGTAGNGVWSVYVDGGNSALTGNSSPGSTVDMSVAAYPFTIGKNSDPSIAPLWMNGDIDNVLVYNRVLTSNEIDCFCAGILPADTCFCGTYSEMSYRPVPGAPNILVECNDTLTAQCNGQAPWTLSGIFLCEGNSCPDSTQMSWMLMKPVGTSSGTMGADPGFNISIPPSEFSTSGVYHLTLNAICGQDTCFCEFTIVVDCDPCCTDYDEFQTTAAAVQTNGELGDCMIHFNAMGLDSCMQITYNWGDNSPNDGPHGNNVAVWHTYPGPGTYTVCYFIDEVDENGNVCWTYEFCEDVLVLCECCQDFDLFCQNLENEVTISVDNDSCKATVNIGNLPDCDYIESINWGDGQVDTGPYPPGSMPMHFYSNNGPYEICYLAIEKDTAGFICFEKLVCDTIELNCLECACPGGNNLVSNSGFENGTPGFPNAQDQINQCTNWQQSINGNGVTGIGEWYSILNPVFPGFYTDPNHLNIMLPAHCGEKYGGVDLSTCEGISSIISPPIAAGDTYTVGFWWSIKEPVTTNFAFHAIISQANCKVSLNNGACSHMCNGDFHVIVPVTTSHVPGVWYFHSKTGTSSWGTMNNITFAGLISAAPVNNYLYIDDVCVEKTPAPCSVTASILYYPGQPAAFTAQATLGLGSTVTQVDWDFGDNSTLTGCCLNSVIHTYNPGPYTVCLVVTATNSAGEICKDTACIDIIIEEPADKCDSVSVFLQQLHTFDCCYSLQTNNLIPNCFSQIELTLSSGTFANSTVTLGWTATGSGNQLILTPTAGGFIPVGTDSPITFCSPGGTNPHTLDVNFGYVTPMGQLDTCHQSIVFDCFIQPVDTCCLDYDFFCLSVENAVSISVDNDSCKATVNIGNLPDCDYLEYLDWGDGHIDYGPHTSGSMVMHVYSGSGSYEVCYLAIELDEDGFICFEKLVCDSIFVDCNPCCTDLDDFLATAAAVQTNGELGDCMIHFNAMGLDSCMQITYVWGDNSPNDGAHGNNVAVWHTYPGPGTYTVCYFIDEVDENGNVCWTYEFCEDVLVLCECCQDFDAFCQKVENAVNISIVEDSCKVIVNIGDLDECNDYLEYVDWGDGTVDNGPFTSNSMTMHVYSGSGVYEICYLAIELDDDGFICFEKIICDTIDINCPACCSQDEAEFCQVVESNTSVTVIPSDTCKITFNVGILPACDHIEWIDWGDANLENGPFGSGTTLLHFYSAPGSYIVSWLAVELDATGAICFEKVLSDTILCTVGINDPDRSYQIDLFPNPTTGELTLHFEAGSPAASEVQIIDLWGRTLAIESLIPSVKGHSLSLSKLPEGVYFVKVTENKVPVWIEKVIKQ